MTAPTNAFGADLVQSMRSACHAQLEARMPESLGRAEDDEAFAGLVERHAAFLYRLAWSLVRNAYDAEDAVQDTFAKLYRTGSWRASIDEKAFLARTCWRVALGHLPRRSVVQVEIEEGTAVYHLTPESEVAKTEASERLHRLIDALPLQLRQPLLLSGFEGLTSREISVILEIPEGTVRTRMKRAREEIRKRWDQADRHAMQAGRRI